MLQRLFARRLRKGDLAASVMLNSTRREFMTKEKSAPSEPNEDAPEINEEELEAVSGGTTMVNRVKTSDKQQKAVLDFVKG